MDRTLYSISFVGVLAKPLQMLSNIDNQFAKDLFDMPDVLNGITPEGYVIAVSNKPFPMVMLNPAKLMIKAQDSQSLVKYMGALKEELSKMGLDISFTSFGVNSEYQWIEIDKSPESWLWEHFIKKTFHSENTFRACNKLNLRIGINEEEVANVEIEPRRGVRDGIFANVNHHHNRALDTIPTSEEAMALIQKSIDTIESEVLQKIIENE